LTDLLRDPRRGSIYEIAGCLTSEESFAEQAIAEGMGVRCFSHPIRPFYRRRGLKLGDLEARREYDAEALRRIRPLAPDALFLAGYLYILTGEALEEFPGPILNVHGSDLTVRDADGNPKYPGLRAVRDSILAGETETRATCHFVTEELDGGPPLLKSPPFPVSPLAALARAWGAEDILRAYAWAHQEWMLQAAWGPLFLEAARLLQSEAGDTDEREIEPLALAGAGA
jgi:folate-dependent phosphoribosylglycinamide formyltransferase PurN